MKKKFNENRTFRMIVVTAVTVLLVAGFSLAWYVIRTADIQNQSLSVSNFDAETYCYFMTSSGSQAATLDENGMVKLSADPDADNYIGKFRVDARYKGMGSGYLRIKIAHKFSATSGAPSAQHIAKIPYTFGSNWYDNRANDYCVYYTAELAANDNTSQTVLNLITGIDESEISNIAADENVEIKVAIEADMVQINRYPQLWGIDKLPWK